MPQIYRDCYLRTPNEFVVLAHELLQTLPQNMEGLKLLPDENRETDVYMLLQPRPFVGRVNWRGINNVATPTRAPFSYEYNACLITPGYWAEFQEINERMMRLVAQPGTCNARLNLVEYERQLLFGIAIKLHQLKESLIWQVLVNGYVEERNTDGITVWSQRYKITRARFNVSACDQVNSTPLADLACIVNSTIGSSGAVFDPEAVMYANSRTWECLLRNRNPNDIGRMGQTACCDPIGMARLAQFFLARGLPQPRVYNGFWLDENKRPNFYIPTGKIVMIGRRPDGERIGSFFQPPTLITCGTAKLDAHGTYVIRQDNMCPDGMLTWQGTRLIRWLYGLEGVPVLKYPRAVIVVDTGCADCDCTPLAEVCPI